MVGVTETRACGSMIIYYGKGCHLVGWGSAGRAKENPRGPRSP